MILAWLIIIPFLGGAAAWFLGRYSSKLPAGVALLSVAIPLLISVLLWRETLYGPPIAGRWFLSLNRTWIPQFGVSLFLAADGLSLLMVMLTFFLGLISVGCSWREIQDRAGAYYLTLLSTIAGITGVFLALDLFLFYFFWELMLVPMYFLIAVWGHEGRRYAAFKFFIFTQACSLFLLVAILALYYLHGRSTGVYTFNYLELLGTGLSRTAAFWIMLGFFIGFAVKLPVVPLHTWLPDAHTEAPTAGSVLLAGILLKTGAYGILRFVLPLFPAASRDFAPAAMTLAVLGILYGAVLSFAQSDLKRLVAYTSVSHLGFVLLGIFAWNEISLQGAVMEMICHALSTGGLFLLAGLLYERLHTRDLSRMGGLWTAVPRIGGAGLFFALASLGLPGLGNFVAEFLILLGSYQRGAGITAAAALGLVAATIYSLWLVQKVFQGPLKPDAPLSDLSPCEGSMLAAMMAVLIWIGVFPAPILKTSHPSVQTILLSGKEAK